MKKRKPPVLTSPWKIGFLVSLLLVLLSVGVNYFLTRIFNLSWSWLTFEHGGWVFHLDHFLNQMLPQIAIIVGLSMIAYFSVTSAVSKYKAYLDSGRDYRNLAHSIRNINDLDDDEKIKKLKEYPELMKFLLDIKSQVEERRKRLAQREEELGKQGSVLGETGSFANECGVLIRTIRRLAKGERAFEGSIGLSHPRLVEIAESIREVSLKGGQKWGDEERARMEHLRKELAEAGVYLKSRLDAISKELQSSGNGAKKVEAQLNAIKEKVNKEGREESGGWNLQALKNISKHLSVMSKLSDTLQDLGEEAKSIAISTALQAGAGEGTLADLIQLAGGVKDIADKFERSSRSYQSLTGDIKKSVAILEKQAKKLTTGIDSEIASSINTLSSKMTLWVERGVVLSDKIKTLEKSYDLSFRTLEEKINGYAKAESADDLYMEAGEVTPFKHEQDESTKETPTGFEKQEPVSPLFAHSTQTAGAQETAQPGEVEAVTAGKDGMSGDMDSGRSSLPLDMAAPEAEMEDLPGIEKEKVRIFAEIAPDEEELFAEMTDKEGEALEGEGIGKKQEPAATAYQRKVEEDEKHDFTAFKLNHLRPENATLPGDKPEDEKEAASGTSSDNLSGEEIIDLYELGAVDYVA